MRTKCTRVYQQSALSFFSYIFLVATHNSPPEPSGGKLAENANKEINSSHGPFAFRKDPQEHFMKNAVEEAGF